MCFKIMAVWSKERLLPSSWNDSSRTEPGNIQAFSKGTINLSLKGARDLILEAHIVFVFVLCFCLFTEFLVEI